MNSEENPEENIKISNENFVNLSNQNVYSSTKDFVILAKSTC